MTVIELFSSSANYKYKTSIVSLSALVVLFFIVLSLLTPLFLIYNTGGFWMKNRVHIELPDTRFEYKYLLLAERDFGLEPVVCSTFSTFKGNRIPDDCSLIKVREIDTNSDGRKDILKFEAYFYSDHEIRSVMLLLFFNFRLRHLFEATIESFAVFDCILNQQAQKVQFIGDLELNQKNLLHSKGLYENYSESIDVAEYSLPELLALNSNKKFSAKITNTQVIRHTGFSDEEQFVIQGELYYKEHIIRYQPDIWEELKWAWIQYLSSVIVFAYLSKHLLTFLFYNRYLYSYIVIPWDSK